MSHEAEPENEQNERERRARLDRAERILGGLVPGSGEDADALDWGEQRGARSRDDDLTRELPPHHGKD